MSNVQYLYLESYIADRVKIGDDDYNNELATLLKVTECLGKRNYRLSFKNDDGNLNLNKIPILQVVTMTLSHIYEDINDFIKLYNKTVNTHINGDSDIGSLSIETLTPSILFNILNKSELLNQMKHNNTIINSPVTQEQSGILLKFIDVLNVFDNSYEEITNNISTTESYQT